MGKNFKTTIIKFIKGTPLRHCVPNQSCRQTNDNDVDEEMPMKENNKSPKSGATSICQNVSRNTTTTLTTQYTQVNTFTDDKTLTVAQMNNCSNSTDGKDSVHEDGQANGIGILDQNRIN